MPQYGGLIAKRYIADQLARKQQLRIDGAIFFATPHQGAELASVVAALSREHKQAKGLKPDAVFLGTLNKHWEDYSCEAHVDTTYVIAGQDSFVSKESAGGPLSSHREIDLNKGHLDIVKPSNSRDYSFLFLRATAKRVLYDKHADFAAATRAIETADSHALEQLIASKGRSWIETRYSDQANDLLNRVVDKFNPDSAEVVWSKYLLIISRLFKFRDTSSTAIDDELIVTSEQLRLAPLLLAEKMELARKRNDQNETIALHSRVVKQLENRVAPRAAGEAYAIGTSHFLVGNLLRFGGLYSAAKASIETARVFFRPAIMSHQIELAHCQYALEVCKAVMGETNGENAVPTGSGEFRPFAEALLTLVRSHSDWSKGRIAEATEHADAASLAFASIGYHPYADRARRLSNLLHVWRRLDLGVPIDRAITAIGEDTDILRALIGLPGSAGTVRDKLSGMRVSHVLGLLQFSSTFNPDWTQDIGEFDLPPMLEMTATGLIWIQLSATSLAEADKMLRARIRVPPNVAVPLIAD